MGIELKWVKKIKSGTVKKFNNFFLSPFNFFTAKTNSRKTTKAKALKVTGANVAHCSAEIIDVPSCNPGDAYVTALIPVSSSIRRIGKCLQKMVVTKKEKGIFSTFKASKILFCNLLTFSLSFFTQKYPQSWKTIFVHLFEKSNLLVRSDNNTGFSSTKILQTTTI